MPPEADRPGVIAPPPLIFALFFAAGWGFDRAFDTGLFAGAAWNRIGGGLVAGGVVLGLAVVVLFRRAHTAIEPWKPTTALVTRGPFRLSRNPTYVALALCHAGLAIILDSPGALALLAPALVALHIGVVRREERYLDRKFGEPYRAYCRAVRRWI